MSLEYVELVDVIKSVVASMLSHVNTCLPGRIEAYEHTEQRADVKPLVSKRFSDGSVLELPVITDVPVVWPRTSQGGITFPLQRGDGCLLVFAQRSLDVWSSEGGVVDPRDTRKFDLTDAIAIPGLYPFKDKGPADNSSDLLIKFGNGTIRMKSDGDIEIGEGELRKLIDDRLISAFNSHIHSGGTLPPSGTTGVPTVLIGNPPIGLIPVSTSKVSAT